MRKIVFLQLVLISAICNAQTETEKKTPVAVAARGYANHIVLRYFAGTPALFTKANQVGYVIEKAKYTEGVTVDKLSYKPLSGSPYKKWEEAKWEAELKKAAIQKDTAAVKLAGLVYTLSDPGVKASAGDVMADGLKSMKAERDTQDMKFGMFLIASSRSSMAAEGLGLLIKDADVVLGSSYVYRIHVNDPETINDNEWSYVQVKCGNFNERYLMDSKGFKMVEGDGQISFSFPESPEYWAFNVERSDDGGNTYKNLTATPQLKLKPTGYTGKTDYGYADKNLTNNKKYFYRVKVSTLFADQLPIAEFTATPKDKTPPQTVLLKSADHINAKQVKLTWETLSKKDPDLKGYNITRSNEIKGKYTLISKVMLPATATTYIDETFNKDAANYYIVESVDQSGNVSQSFAAYVTLIDDTPPAKPVILSAVIDTLGKITIKMKPNLEKDFMGYEVLKANARDHEFSIIEQTFKDTLDGGHTRLIIKDSTTLNTLTRKIYYKVIAYDYHFNPSAASEIIELKRRDTIAPAPPAILDFSVKEGQVVIKFANSGSEDAVSNILLRKDAGKGKYEPVFTNINPKITEYTDKNIIDGKAYEYAMTAKDDSGLYSKMSRGIEIKTLVNMRLPTPILKGIYDAKTKKVALSFTLDEKLKTRKVNIELYRRADAKSLWTIVKTLDSTKTKTYTDDPVKGQKAMLYSIRLVENDRVSSYSKPLEIQF